MSEVKRAQEIEIFLCDTCSAVHIGLFRDGKMFAEAIPQFPEMVLVELQKAIAGSDRRRAKAERH